MCVARETVMRVHRPLIATPMLPNLRPSPPLRSRNPRCSRAGTLTVTLFGALLNRSLPRLDDGRGISITKSRTRLRHLDSVSYTHLRAHETVLDLVCRLLLEKK